MYARSLTVRAHPQCIDNGIRHVRGEVMPTLLDTPGCIGLSMLVDRFSRNCIVTSAWDSQEAMDASHDLLDPIRNHTAEALGGRPQVDQWEIAVMHRDHLSREGSRVRGTWLWIDPQRCDDAVDTYRWEVLPALYAIDGFCSASMLLDRQSGICCSSVAFDSQRAIELSRKDVRPIRENYLRATGGELLDYCEYELVLAHLRVPELT